MLCEDRDIPFVTWHQPILKTSDVLTSLLIYRISLFFSCEQRSIRTSECVEHIIKSKQMSMTNAIIQSSRRVPVVVVRTRILIRLLTGRVKTLRLTQPIVFILRSIYVEVFVFVIISRQCQIEMRYEQISLDILHRRHERVAMTMLGTIDYFLSHTGLYLLIHL